MLSLDKFFLVRLLGLLLLIAITSEVLAQDPFVVGVSMPLTGEAAEAGIAAQNGLKMALEENPEAFRRFQFIYEDNKYDGTAGVSTFTKLVSINQAQLVFMWGDTPAIAAAPLAERTKVPMVATLTDHTSVNRNPYVVRFINSYDQYADTLVSYFRKENVRSVGAVVVELAYYSSYFEAIQKRMSGDSEAVLVAKVLPDASDFRSIVLKLRARKFDRLGFLVLPGQITLLFKQLGAIGVTAAPFGADDFESESMRRDVGEAMEGSVYSMNIVTDDFQTRYIKRFGNDLFAPYAANAFEFALLLSTLRLDESPRDGQSIIDRLATFRGSSGAMGRYFFCEDSTHGRYFYFPIVVKKVEGASRRTIHGSVEPSGCPKSDPVVSN